MSFQDIDKCDQAVLISNSHVDQLGDITPTSQSDLQYPQFNQSNILSDVSPIQLPPQQYLSKLRKSIVPQTNYGLFGYVIDNQKKLFDIFQSFIHRTFLMWYYKTRIEESDELNIPFQIELQGLRRKLAYLSNAYNQTFISLKNCIIQYQEKVIGITDQQENDKEDPYSILSQSEIQLRRALHEFYTFLENEDPYVQSQTKQLCSNLIHFYYSRSQIKSQAQFESYEPGDLVTANIDQISSFVLNSLEQEEVHVEYQDIVQDQVGVKLLKVVQQLISVWVFLFKMMQNYDVNSVQFNFEIEQADLNAMIITSNAILYVPQDIYQKILKPYSQVKEQLLNYSLKTPGSQQYALTSIYKNLSMKKNPIQQSFINFDKLDQLLKVAENDTLTKQSENFSFSEKHSEIRDDDEDESQLKYQSRQNKENIIFRYTQTIMAQAFEITFKGRINETHLQEMQPPKHRFYITEAGLQWKRVVPFVINSIKYSDQLSVIDNSQIEILTNNYFPQSNNAQLMLIKPFTKFVYQTQIQENLNESQSAFKIALDIPEPFQNKSKSIVASTGQFYVFNPYNSQMDKSFYILQNNTLIELPSMPEKKQDFGIIYYSGNIFVIGGQYEDEQYSKSCHRFDIKKAKWYQVASLNNAVASPNLCIFQDRGIVRCGGLGNFGYFDRTCEKYDFRKDQWIMAKIIQDENTDIVRFNLNAMMIQINHQEIILLGGKNENGYSEKDLYLLELQEKVSRTDSFIQLEISKLKQQQPTLLNFMGEIESQVVIQFNKIWLLRKDYSNF